MTLPTNQKPQQGTFIASRLSALARFLEVNALRPQPWFPLVRSPLVSGSPRSSFNIEARRMLYIPGLFKACDGRFMERCITAWLRESRVDVSRSILDAHFGYPEGVACYFSARKMGLPCFITLRGVELDWFRNPSVRSQMLEALCGVNGVIAVSQSLKDEAVARGVPASQITVIENGVEKNIFFPGNKLEHRERLSIPPRTKVFVCVANLKPVKGHAVLFKALAKLEGDLQWMLYCIGSHEPGGTLAHLKKLRNALGLERKIDFLGGLPSEQVADYLRACDLFMLASHREGCCNAIIEAMACGCRIVCTDVGDNSRLLREYNRCHIVPVSDSDALALEVSQAMNANEYSPLSECKSVGSWESVAERTIEFFQERMHEVLKVTQNDY